MNREQGTGNGEQNVSREQGIATLGFPLATVHCLLFPIHPLRAFHFAMSTPFTSNQIVIASPPGNINISNTSEA